MSLREILEAKVASLKETAGQLKGLAELKQNIADNAECPPENPDSFRQKALEHKRHAMALADHVVTS